LRRDQVEGTRQRIIEAVVRVVSDGIGALSIPAVAREAGVSVPTVYRHFGSKDELLEALGLYYSQQIGAVPEPWPEGLDDVERFLYKIFERAESVEPALRAAMLTNTGRAARRAILPQRLEVMEHAIGPLLDRLPPDERKLAQSAILILSTTATQRAFNDYLGADAHEAARSVAWAIRRLVGTE
jgi:AcrR family transcriptional regulator